MKNTPIDNYKLVCLIFDYIDHIFNSYKLDVYLYEKNFSFINHNLFNDGKIAIKNIELLYHPILLKDNEPFLKSYWIYIEVHMPDKLEVEDYNHNINIDFTLSHYNADRHSNMKYISLDNLGYMLHKGIENLYKDKHINFYIKEPIYEKRFTNFIGIQNELINKDIIEHKVRKKRIMKATV